MSSGSRLPARKLSRILCGVLDSCWAVSFDLNDGEKIMPPKSEVVTCGDFGAGVSGEGFWLRGVKFPFDPRMNPLPNSAPFDAIGSVSVIAGATETIISVSLGRNEWLMINRLGQEILDSPAGTALTGFGACTWRLKVSGAPSQFYGNLQDQIGTGLADRHVMMLIAEPMATVQAEVYNSHATDAFLCLWTFQGWTIPIPGI